LLKFPKLILFVCIFSISFFCSDLIYAQKSINSIKNIPLLESFPEIGVDAGKSMVLPIRDSEERMLTELKKKEI
jgi:hypothetical protein